MERDRLLDELGALKSNSAWRLSRPLRRLEARLPWLLRGAELFLELAAAAMQFRRSSPLQSLCDVWLIARSRLFDPEWYLVRNPDVPADTVLPLNHWMREGWTAGLDPGPLFSTSWYLSQSLDVRQAGVNPLAHFLRQGAGEGRNPHPLFDIGRYLSQNPGMDFAGINPLLHYLKQGAIEGLNPHPLFDTRWYLEQHADVRATGVNPLLHYLKTGGAEGRTPHPLFDAGWYLEQSPSARRSKDSLLVHYLLQGAQESHSPHPLFDPTWYLEENPDVRAAGINPLLHFLERGATEGRNPHPLFDTRWYLEQNADARAAGINPLVHYLTKGGEEGRDPHPLFDAARYLEQNPRVRRNRDNPLVHYLRQGRHERCSPHPLFDATWYLRQNPDCTESGEDPLIHYLTRRAKKGCSPHPLFDTTWYSQKYPDARDSELDPLAHYLLRGAAKGYDPNPLFATSWFRDTNPDVGKSGLNPLVHYVLHSAAEGRDPSRSFVAALHLSLDSGVSETFLARFLGFLEGNRRRLGRPRDDSYCEWVRAFDAPHRNADKCLRRRLVELPNHPLVSVLLSVSGKDLDRIDACLSSVLAQVYARWELCVDASDSAAAGLRSLLERFAERDPRIKIHYTPISFQGTGSIQTIPGVSGDYLLFLDSNALLSTHALGELALAIRDQDAPDLLYSDEDRILANGRRDRPVFKPDWSPTLYRQVPYLGGVVAARYSRFVAAEGPDTGRIESQVRERVHSLAAGTGKICHIPRVLYHRRCTGPDTSVPAISAPAFDSHANRAAGVYLPDAPAQHRETQKTPSSHSRHAAFPLVSAIIWTHREPRTIIERAGRLLAEAGSPSLEIVIAINLPAGETGESATRNPGSGIEDRVRLLEIPDSERNASKIYNKAAAIAKGVYLLIADEHIDVLTSDFLKRLLAGVEDEGIGAVGPRIQYPDGRLQTAGGVVGLEGAVGDCMRGVPETEARHYGLLENSREVGALSATCLLVEKERFSAIGGFDEHFTRRVYAGEDLCLRLRRLGLRVLHIPAAVVSVPITAAEQDDDTQFEKALFIDRWEPEIEAGDPYYNPNLELEKGRFGLAFPPR